MTYENNLLLLLGLVVKWMEPICIILMGFGGDFGMVWSSMRLVWSLAPLSRIILSVVMKYVFQPRNPESEDSSDDGGTDDLDLSNIKRLTSSPFK